MKALKISIVPVAVLLLATGCASGNPFLDSWENTGSRTNELKQNRYDGPATLDLQNDHRADVDVYLLHLGTETRLGKVKSMSRRSLRVSPQHLHNGMGTLLVEVRPIGSTESFVTQPLLLESGNRVSLEIRPHLQVSTYRVVTK